MSMWLSIGGSCIPGCMRFPPFFSSFILDWQNNDGFWFLRAEMATTIGTSYQPSLVIVQTQQVWSLLAIYTCQASHNHIYCSAKIYIRKLKYIKSFHLGAFSKPSEYNTFLFPWGFLNIQMLYEKILYTVDMLLNKPSKGQSCWHNFESLNNICLKKKS